MAGTSATRCISVMTKEPVSILLWSYVPPPDKIPHRWYYDVANRTVDRLAHKGLKLEHTPFGIVIADLCHVAEDMGGIKL